MKFRLLPVVLMLAGLFTAGAADKRHDAVATMTNPLIWADVPDPDVIRVGEDYYMVTTTMHMMPGCPVMHSRDLVNWEVISYVFDALDDTPSYRLEGGTVYGKGQWATSLRYHNGLYYVLFSPNDHPYKSYIYTAENPAGPWKLHSRPKHFHDSSLLFDDDGRVYVFSGSGNIRLTELDSDLKDVKAGGVDTIVIRTDDETAGLHEGSRVIKHNGKYYAMIINWPSGRPRRQLCYRADKITGPYERMTVLEDNFAGFPYLAQGTIVDTPEGDWWGVIFQDRNAVGRVLTLSPCRWVDGWPMLGDKDGRVPLHIEYKPASEMRTTLVKTDNFDDKKLGFHWQWNHCPDNTAWSLSERPGHLRLKTSRPANTIYDAVNTVTQRMEGPGCEGTVCIDLSGMKNGDVAGFGALNGHSTLLSVKKEKGKKTLVKHNTEVSFHPGSKVIMAVGDVAEESVALDGDKIYLRIKGDFRLGRDKANCYYSTDGKSWASLGKEYQMKYDYRLLFMGQRFAIYNYSTDASSAGGYIDVDSFDYRRLSEEELAAEMTD